MKRIKNSLRDIWDNIKCTKIQIIRTQKKKREKKEKKKTNKKKQSEKIFEEIIVENFPNMGKEIVNQFQEVQRVP